MSSNDQGGLFARYLIRTQGIDAFVRYYQQAPGRRDPALFAANFSAFWNLNIDDAWTAMHTVRPGAGTIDSEICPCSLSALPTDGQPPDSDLARHPYWLLPDTGGASLALVAPTGGAFFVSDCEGIAPLFVSGDSAVQTSDPAVPSLPDAMIAFVQFPSDGRRFPPPLSAPRSPRRRWGLHSGQLRHDGALPAPEGFPGRIGRALDHRRPDDRRSGDEVRAGSSSRHRGRESGSRRGRLRQLCVRPGSLYSKIRARPSALLERRVGAAEPGMARSPDLCRGSSRATWKAPRSSSRPEQRWEPGESSAVGLACAGGGRFRRRRRRRRLGRGAGGRRLQPTADPDGGESAERARRWRQELAERPLPAAVPGSRLSARELEPLRRHSGGRVQRRRAVAGAVDWQARSPALGRRGTLAIRRRVRPDRVVPGNDVRRSGNRPVSRRRVGIRRLLPEPATGTSRRRQRRSAGGLESSIAPAASAPTGAPRWRSGLVTTSSFPDDGR